MEAEDGVESSDSTRHSEARRELESYLNKRMRIGISDGRVIDGMFLCTDKDCNIVLGNCEEFLSQDEVGMNSSSPWNTSSCVAMALHDFVENCEES